MGATQGAAAYWREWFTNLDAVSADDGSHARRGQTHRLRHGCQVRMHGDDQFGVAAGAAQSGSGEAAFGTLTSSEDKFAFADGHAMKLRRIVEAEEPALHRAAVRIFGEHRGDVPAGALYAAGSVEFRKYADEHWVSLPSAAMERKGAQIFVSSACRRARE